MNSRLDQDQDNAALTEIKNLQSDFAELKSRQSIGRALVKRTYVVQTANAFDLSAYSIPANTLHSFVITVTGDGSQPSLMASSTARSITAGRTPAIGYRTTSSLTQQAPITPGYHRRRRH
ncbi:hypothetical protein AHiyo8_59410 [Arthrobacter sp. Hiyo8]|nr:hypothetical protein AHiyo8_59410 [Arthrobacter sp. Hiyo8]